VLPPPGVLLDRLPAVGVLAASPSARGPPETTPCCGLPHACRGTELVCTRGRSWRAAVDPAAEELVDIALANETSAAAAEAVLAPVPLRSCPSLSLAVCASMSSWRATPEAREDSASLIGERPLGSWPVLGCRRGGEIGGSPLLLAVERALCCACCGGSCAACCRPPAGPQAVTAASGPAPIGRAGLDTSGIPGSGDSTDTLEAPTTGASGSGTPGAPRPPRGAFTRIDDGAPASAPAAHPPPPSPPLLPASALRCWTEPACGGRPRPRVKLAALPASQCGADCSTGSAAVTPK
jgi:hypothetical protein